MERFQPGELVKERRGYYGLFISYQGDHGELADVLLGNGLSALLNVEELERIYIPNSSAPQSFHEAIYGLLHPSPR